MKLFGISGSPNTWKVRAVAHHAGQELAFEEVDVFKGENRTPAFLALSPRGRTPVLVDGDHRLWESTAIMQYLAAINGSQLWPDGHRERADVMRWQSWQIAHWGKEACEPLVFENMLKPMFKLGPADTARIERAEKAFASESGVLEAHLKGRDWLVGNVPTLADFSVGSYLFLAEPARMPLQQHPHVSRWFARVAALPCWAATAPKMTAPAA